MLLMLFIAKSVDNMGKSSMTDLDSYIFQLSHAEYRTHGGIEHMVFIHNPG